MTLPPTAGGGAPPVGGVAAFVAGAPLPRLSPARSPAAAARRARPRAPPLGVPGRGRPPPRRRITLAASPPTPPHPPAAAASGSAPSAGKATGAPASAPAGKPSAPPPTPQGAAAPGAYGAPLPSPGGEPSPSAGPSAGGPERPPDYFANVGKVIETLRADYPALPRRTPNLSIYSPAIAFSAKHPPGGVAMLLPALHGIDAYAALLWATRAHVRVLLVAPSVRVLSLYHDVPGGRLYLRWRLAGTPRHVAVVARGGGSGGRRGGGGGDGGGGPAWMFDGMSVYHLGNDGWVAAHELDPNVWNKRKLKTVQAVLAGGLGRQQLARGRPGRGVAAGVAGYPQLWWEEEADGRCEAGDTPAAAAAVAADAADGGGAGAEAAAPSLLVPPGGADLGGGAAL